MKKIRVLLLAIIMLTAVIVAKAQDIQITKFERNYTSLIASMDPVYDNAGDACAVIRFFTREKDFRIEPNLGVLKKVSLPGEIRLWVPKGTKRITVRHKNLLPLTGYEIPVQIEQKVTYEAAVELSQAAQQRKDANDSRPIYVGVGYNITMVSGPSVAIGVNVNHHNIELGGVYGLNKTDGLYFYDTNGNTTGAYKYSAIMVSLRYGYEFAVSDFFSITPMAGGRLNIYTGKQLAQTVSSTDYKNAKSMSVLGGLRFTLAFSKTVKLQVTPEYGVAFYQNDPCKTITWYDKTTKNWNTGFNLNAGLQIYF